MELAGIVAKAKLGKGYAYLDPSGQRLGKIRERWRIIENVRIEPGGLPP
jgi:predicted transcriptional regulator of viral defense system